MSCAKIRTDSRKIRGGFAVDSRRLRRLRGGFAGLRGASRSFAVALRRIHARFALIRTVTQTCTYSCGGCIAWLCGRFALIRAAHSRVLLGGYFRVADRRERSQNDPERSQNTENVPSDRTFQVTERSGPGRNIPAMAGTFLCHGGNVPVHGNVFPKGPGTVPAMAGTFRRGAGTFWRGRERSVTWNVLGILGTFPPGGNVPGRFGNVPAYPPPQR